MAQQPRRAKGVSGPTQSGAFSQGGHSDPNKQDMLSGFLKGSHVQGPLDDSGPQDDGVDAANNIGVFLKNLTKPSETTKLKALNDLVKNVKMCPDDLLSPYIANIVERYNDHVFHTNAGIRSLFNRVLITALEPKGVQVRKAFSSAAERLIGPWLCSMNDSDITVKNTALEAWDLAFPVEKRPIVMAKLLPSALFYIDESLQMVKKAFKDDSQTTKIDKVRLCLLAMGSIFQYVGPSSYPELCTFLLSTSEPTGGAHAGFSGCRKFLPGQIGNWVENVPAVRLAAYRLLTCVPPSTNEDLLHSPFHEMMRLSLDYALNSETSMISCEAGWAMALTYFKAISVIPRFDLDVVLGRESETVWSSLINQVLSPTNSKSVRSHVIADSLLPFLAILTKEECVVKKQGMQLLKSTLQSFSEATIDTKTVPSIAWTAIKELFELLVVIRLRYTRAAREIDEDGKLFDFCLNALCTVANKAQISQLAELIVKLIRRAETQDGGVGVQYADLFSQGIKATRSIPCMWGVLDAALHSLTRDTSMSLTLFADKVISLIDSFSDDSLSEYLVQRGEADATQLIPLLKMNNCHHELGPRLINAATLGCKCGDGNATKLKSLYQLALDVAIGVELWHPALDALMHTFYTLVTEEAKEEKNSALSLEVMKAVLESLMENGEKYLTEEQLAELLKTGHQLGKDGNLPLLEVLVPFLWDKISINDIVDGLCGFFNGQMVYGHEDEKGNERSEDEDEEDVEEEEEKEEECDIFRLKNKNLEEVTTIAEGVLNLLGHIWQTPTEKQKIKKNKPLKRLQAVLFDVTLLLSPYTAPDAYVSTTVSAAITENADSDEVEESSSSSCDEEEEDLSDPISYLELWKHRPSIKLDRLLELLGAFHDFVENTGLEVSMHDLLQDLTGAIVSGNANKTVCAVSHKTVLCFVEVFQFCPTDLYNPSLWDCRSSLLHTPTDSTETEQADWLKGVPRDLQLPCSLSCEATRTVLAKSQAVITLAELLVTPVSEAEEGSSPSSALFAQNEDFTPADGFAMLQELVCLSIVGESALSPKAKTAVDSLVYYFATNTSFVEDLVLCTSNATLRPIGPLLFLSVVQHLAVENKKLAETLISRAVTNWVENPATMDVVVCTTAVTLTSVFQVCKQMPQVGWTLSYSLKLRLASRTVDEDKLQKQLATGRLPYHKAHALLCILSLLDCPLQAPAVDAAVRCIRGLNGGVDSLALSSALIKSMITTNPLDLVGPVIEALSKTVSLAHFPTNGKLGQQVSGTTPTPMANVAKVSREVTAIYEGMRLHPTLTANDTMKSTLNLAMFDLLVSSLFRLQLAAGVQKKEELVEIVNCVAAMSPFFNSLTSVEIKSLRASSQSLSVLTKVIFTLHSFIGACGPSRIELLGINNLLRLTTNVCQVGLVALVGSKSQDIVEVPEEVVALLQHAPVPAVKRLDESLVKFGALRGVATSIHRSLKSQLSLLTYLVGSAAYVSMVQSTEEVANHSTNILHLLNTVGALALTPLPGSTNAKEGGGRVKSISIQSCYLTAPDTDALGYNLKALGEYSEETSAQLKYQLAAGAVSLIPLLLQGPASRVFKQWYQSLDRTLSTAVESFVSSHISPLLIQSSLSEILAFSGGAESFDYNDDTKITLSLENRVVLIEFEKDEAKTSIRISVPPQYPLQPPFVLNADTKDIKSGGLGVNKYRSWLMKMMSGSSCNVGLWDWIRLYCDNLTARYDGVEPCPICYGTVSAVDRKLPELSCSVCTNAKFHSSCLYQWWRNSGQTSCPTCRTPWYSK